MYHTKHTERLQDYKQHVRIARQLINRLKKKYLDEGLGDTATSKEAWHLARNLMGLKTHKTPEKLVLNGAMETDPGKIAGILNSYFSDKIKILRRLHLNVKMRQLNI